MSDSLLPKDENLTSDTSDDTQATSEHVYIHSTDVVTRTDDMEVREDITSDNQEKHEKEKCKHDTQIQKQQKTSNINYGGTIIYESRGKNKWLMRFIAVKDLNALTQYVLTHYPQAEVDQSVSFKFGYDSYYLELIMDKEQEKPVNEWVISPHIKPCKLSKESMDKFGRSDSSGLPDPPSCLVSIYAKDEHKADELLSYAVPLKGVVSITEEIFITRFLETTDTSRTVQQISAPCNQTGSSTTHDTQNDPLSKVCHCPLGIDDINEISMKCNNFMSHWEFIGIQLRVKKTTLDNIQENHHDTRKRMLEMLASWLRKENEKQPVPTWNILLTTLSEYDSIQTKKIASEFKCTHK